MGTTSQLSVKEHMVQIIRDQPEDSSFDEILRELAFARMIERGLEDVDQGRTVSHEAVSYKPLEIYSPREVTTHENEKEL